MKIQGSANIHLARNKFIPKILRVVFGALEMRLRTGTNFRDRLRFIHWVDLKKLPTYTAQREQELDENIIWQYWAQGIDAAPEIIRICIQSVSKYNGNKTHIVLSDRDVFNYIELPEHISNKWELINPTKRSNILRLALIAKYGGIWLDATCFLSTEIPDQYFKANFFAFSNSSQDRLLRTWFLAAKKNNPIIILWLRMHYKFYQYYTKPPCYFFFHYMFENLVTMEESIRKLWTEIKTDEADPENNELYASILALKPIEDTIHIIQRTWINKLSWRLDPIQVKLMQQIADQISYNKN